MEAATQFELEEAERFLAGLPERADDCVGRYGGRFVESDDLMGYDGPVEEARLVNALKELGVEAQTDEELLALATELTHRAHDRTARKQEAVIEIQKQKAAHEAGIAEINASIKASKARANAAFGLPHIIFLGVVLLIVGAFFVSMTNKREPSPAEKACEGLGGQISMDGQNCKF